jgi:GxxExxY protein
MHADKTNIITEAVLGAAFEVSNTLGAGFLEKVYRRALIHELKLRGMRVSEEVSFSIDYKGCVVGQYFADLLVEDEVVVELKCIDSFSKEHMAQCINYLKASGRTVCLLLNFKRPRVEYKRIVHEFTPELS